MEGKRRYELDLCRILACFMVICIHVIGIPWNDYAPDTHIWKVANCMDFIVRSAVPLFFMISGVLFLNRDELDIKCFFKKHILHMILIYIVWSTIYAIFSYENWESLLASLSDIDGWSTLAHKIIDGNYHLWFIKSLVMAYIFLLIIHRAVHKKEIKVFYLLFIFLIVIILKANITAIPNLPSIVTKIFNIFDLNNVAYIGYMILGYWIAKRSYHTKKTIAISSIAIIVTVIIASIANQRYSIAMGQASDILYGGFMLPTLINAIAIFCMFQCFKDKTIKGEKIIKEISGSTFGIYLIHDLLLEISKKYEVAKFMFEPISWVLIVSIIIFILSLVVITILRRIPVVKRVVT